ncbi:cytochrome P450 3A14-like isoform X1 [Haemaphysalis longicornis]
MIVLVGVLTLAVVVVAAFIRWRQRHFSYFKRLGVPGPEPSLLWGNIREYHETDHHKVLDMWLETYGDTFGFYDGDVPFIVTKDLDFLEYVFVRNAKIFTDRGVTLSMEQNHPLLRHAIVYAEGAKWRNIRKAVAPGFTPAKLKQIMVNLKSGTDVFIGIVSEHADAGQEVDTFQIYQRLTMDFVGRSALGVDRTFQLGPEDPLALAAKKVLQGIMRGPFHFFCQSTTRFGALVKPLHWINMLLGAYVAIAMTDESRKVIELRRKDPNLRKNDVLQSLLDAEYQEDSGPPSNDTPESINRNDSTTKGRVMTPEEVLVSACTLFVAGYDTTSSALSFLTYLLATHQDIQEKVREEVNEVFSSDGDLDYETLTRKLPYVNQVINEALRLYPPVLTFVTRKAVEDFEYNGSKYKAGTCVMSPTLQIHRDARYWNDPLIFNPERFSPENEKSVPKMAYQPFGMGPRNCLGSRMAQMSLAYTVARLVHSFKLQLGPSHKEGSLGIRSRAMVASPSTGPWIIFRRM